MSMTLGDAAHIILANEWYSQYNNDRMPPLNDAFLRKLMRPRPLLQASRQYWIEFQDIETLKKRALGESIEYQIEERCLDPFKLGVDWCSSLLRKQNATQASVILTVDKEPVVACLFTLYP